jgi:ABC-type dipeptide/oligopeptide/nickel transport system permease subunit
MAAAREFAHEAAEGLRAPSSTRFRDALYLLLANKVGLMGGLLTLFVLCVAGVGWVVLATDSLHHLYLDQKLSDSLLAPGVNGHTLGTDQYGRDILWRTIVGTGISMLIAIVATSVTLVLGMAMGGIAGYVGGKLDTVITALIDLTWGFPLLLVAVIYAGILEPGLAPVILAVATVVWAGFARVVRAQVKGLREREFIEAARALGTPTWKILLRHLFPNVLGTVLVMASYYVAITVIAEAGFSFIGLGAQPPTPSLGQMISDGRNYWTISIYPAIVPGIAIAIIVLGLNSFGDGLRDIFDPRTREQ